MKKTLAVIALMLCGATCNVRQDSSPVSAVEAGDLTVPVAGCGGDVQNGLIHVRAVDGAPQSCVIKIFVPVVDCDADSCFSVRVIRKDGSDAPLGGIPKGQDSTAFKMSDLTGSTSPYERSDGGPYRLVVLGEYKDSDGLHTFSGDAVVYVTVLDQRYLRLECGGPDVAWRQDIGSVEAHFTTKFRTALCPKGE